MRASSDLAPRLRSWEETEATAGTIFTRRIKYELENSGAKKIWVLANAR